MPAKVRYIDPNGNYIVPLQEPITECGQIRSATIDLPTLKNSNLEEDILSLIKSHIVDLIERAYVEIIINCGEIEDLGISDAGDETLQIANELLSEDTAQYILEQTGRETIASERNNIGTNNNHATIFFNVLG